MGNTIAFDFKDMFPTCKNKYSENIQNRGDSTYNTYKTVCSEICKEFGDRDYYFLSVCQRFIKYLKYIYDEKNINIGPYCRYFNFKLNEELESLTFINKNTKEAYRILIEKYKSEYEDEEINKCQDYVGNLDNNTLYILEKLQELYDNFEKMKFYNKSYEGPQSTENTEETTEAVALDYSDITSEENYDKQPPFCKFTEDSVLIYKNLLKICNAGNNNSFCEVLKKYKEEYNHFMESVPGCAGVPKILQSYYGKYMHKHLINRLKKLGCKKYNEYENLTDFFERTYDNLNDKNYIIEYASLN
ncbi:variable surface protein [Plasmodium gonderi]|uniref:Variable surface protein n=1 Tax=Plasmodium gonderi TaxID=77519 RepID=A0A1Y1JNL1_PLAGO|nr:variable surface protein [Plasmodium gonderi]GAW84051.1 variable surface protein [Plasmodium gonderi]